MKTANLKFSDYSASILSGLLLGLSTSGFLSFSFGFLAWFAFVPLLLELENTEKFGVFGKKVLLTCGIGFALISFWVIFSSAAGFLASWLSGVSVWSVPLLALYFLRRLRNWNFALFLLPFGWTFWEFLYHQSEISFGAVRVGYTQSEMLWLIQFADIFGVDGVSFWLVAVNCLIFYGIKSQQRKDTGKKEENAIFSPARIGVLAVLAAFVLPLLYALFIFCQTPISKGEINFSAIQPNISPFVEFTPENAAAMMAKQIVLTEKAIEAVKPDLMVWHEVSVPYTLSRNDAANKFLAKQLAKTDSPVLLGSFETIENKHFNAAFVVSSANLEKGKIIVNHDEMYFKRRLIPFVESVPYADYLPNPESWLIKIGSRPALTAGTEAKNVDFTAQNGAMVRVGVLICYENLYPELSAEAVRNGAQFLAAITNEGWFARSQGQAHLAGFSRFRSIETRREAVRVASTGVTWAVDKFGATKSEVPALSEQILTGKLLLFDEITFYVRYPTLFPQICLAVFLLAICGAVLGKLRKNLRRNSL